MTGTRSPAGYSEWGGGGGVVWQEAKSWTLYLGQSDSRTHDLFDCWTYGRGQAGEGVRTSHPSSSDQSDGPRVQAQVSSVSCVAAEPRPLSRRLHY